MSDTQQGIYFEYITYEANNSQFMTYCIVSKKSNSINKYIQKQYERT